MSFAFSTADMVLSAADMVLSPINEGVYPITQDGDDEAAENFVNVSKMRTSALAHAAEKELIEISALLGKLKTGTATRDEKCRLDSLNAKLDGLKNDIEASPRRSWNCLH